MVGRPCHPARPQVSRLSRRSLTTLFETSLQEFRAETVSSGRRSAAGRPAVASSGAVGRPKFLTQVGGLSRILLGGAEDQLLEPRSSSTLCCSSASNIASSTHSPASSAGAVASPAPLHLPAAQPHQQLPQRPPPPPTADAPAATPRRRPWPPPPAAWRSPRRCGCFQCSTCCPALLSSLNSDSIRHRQ